jgi:hypothetical protein
MISLALAVLRDTGRDFGVSTWFNLWRVAMYDRARLNSAAWFVTLTHLSVLSLVG